MLQTSLSPTFARVRFPKWPLAIWLVLITLAIGLASGLGADGFTNAFNTGFSRSLGEFALILLPSFALAAAMAHHQVRAPARVAAIAAPFAGAGMVCPDTAYASLSPIAGARKLDVAFGAYAGFKLLFPAGPLIVATGMGVQSDSLVLYSFFVFVPVWATGVLWARFRHGKTEEGTENTLSGFSWRHAAVLFSPFCLMLLLLVVGRAFDFTRFSVLDFLTQPKGALISAAVLALSFVPSAARHECLETALRRTGSLLLIIGVASAFGWVCLQMVSIESLLAKVSGVNGILGIFLLTALFKLIQGSSMATFAAVTPVAAALVSAMGVPPVAGVFAICAGSFVAILPNDSFYWLVRKDALTTGNELTSTLTLAVGSGLQALVALGLVMAAVSFGLLQ